MSQQKTALVLAERLRLRKCHRWAPQTLTVRLGEFHSKDCISIGRKVETEETLQNIREFVEHYLKVDCAVNEEKNYYGEGDCCNLKSYQQVLLTIKDFEGFVH